MSESLFYELREESSLGEACPTTKYIDGDKSFGELEKGDALYCIDRGGNLSSLSINNGWHKSLGIFRITTSDPYFRNINFGTEDNWKTKHVSKNGSVVFLNGFIIGTNPNSVINEMKRELERQIHYSNERVKVLEKILDKVNALSQE